MYNLDQEIVTDSSSLKVVLRHNTFSVWVCLKGLQPHCVINNGDVDRAKVIVENTIPRYSMEVQALLKSYLEKI